MKSNRLMSNRLVAYRLMSYRLVSLGGDVSMRWGNILRCRLRRVLSAPTLLVVPPSYVWLVIPLRWGKVLIC